MTKREKMSSISPERLKYAREYYGISIQHVSMQSKISVEDLEKYEKGMDYPSYHKLEVLSKLYNRPLLYFFFQTPPPEEELTVKMRSIERRMGVSLDMQIRMMMEKAEAYRLNLQDMLRDTHTLSFHDMIKKDGIENSNQLCSWVREKLDFSLEKQKSKFHRAEEELEYLRERFYDIGVYIFKDSFRKDTVSGLCLYDESFPIILINNKTTFTRQVFTVFHELYHVWIRESDVYFPDSLEEEMECDRFASELLIPDVDLELKISTIKSFENKSIIEDIAKEYTVSPTAIAYRLLKKEKISRELYLEVQDDGIRRMNSANSGGNFYYTRISYLGRRYLGRIYLDYYSGKINVATACKYTGLKAVHISRLSSYLSGGVL